jgi:hypothetical protein
MMKQQSSFPFPTNSAVQACAKATEPCTSWSKPGAMVCRAGKISSDSREPQPDAVAPWGPGTLARGAAWGCGSRGAWGFTQRLDSRAQMSDATVTGAPHSMTLALSSANIPAAAKAVGVQDHGSYKSVLHTRPVRKKELGRPFDQAHTHT